mmetsp:Transcript_14742/g.41505  ORF Transcript_14742/g.41505 Transcript_14742/m.41505 type:complete len:170 (-) Transcript_14742:441-950(-)|eukprot:CAMPEP_0117691906 /NCGR_PEP_ID=MMETSP0804-20121206/26010_1 /TAXON_ID=1074897 /ORGANISM="Tetraselmis astigmatica, Strain CCMP880" /LENGTH=169 /DNA_ID=CAMNT_0005505251 /DNA_START=292 /DNA_END=801 /DNA_ORIENTATION=+
MLDSIQCFSVVLLLSASTAAIRQTCEQHHSEAACLLQHGCRWVRLDSECIEPADDCDGLSEATCRTVSDCRWLSAEKSCILPEDECEPLERAECEQVPVCRWHQLDDLCFFPEDACEGLSKVNCLASNDTGCIWNFDDCEMRGRDVYFHSEDDYEEEDYEDDYKLHHEL